MAAPATGQTHGSLLSIVAVAYNNEGVIEECVRSLLAQTYFPKEIVLVADEASKDGTIRAAERVSSEAPVVLVKCQGVDRSEARNIGWKRAAGEVIFFADGDDVYSDDYAEKALRCLDSDPSVGGVCVGGASLVRNATLMERYHASFGPTDKRLEPPGMVPDWAFVYRRRCLDEAGGYTRGWSQAEDRDLCQRVKRKGYTIGYVPGVHWYHRKPGGFGQFISKEYRAGRERVPYEVHQRGFRRVSINLAPLLVVVALIAIAPFFLGIDVVLILAGFLGYGIATAFRRPAKAGRYLDYLAFPFVALSGRLASSLGSFIGIARSVRLRRNSLV
jgi:glycosyltransferase involved in cell wall biosynthesis